MCTSIVIEIAENVILIVGPCRVDIWVHCNLRWYLPCNCLDEACRILVRDAMKLLICSLTYSWVKVPTLGPSFSLISWEFMAGLPSKLQFSLMVGSLVRWVSHCFLFRESNQKLACRLQGLRQLMDLDEFQNGVSWFVKWSRSQNWF